LEIADDRDAVELAVQDQIADFDPGGADLLEQLAGQEPDALFSDAVITVVGAGGQNQLTPGPLSFSRGARERPPRFHDFYPNCPLLGVPVAL